MNITFPNSSERGHQQLKKIVCGFEVEENEELNE